MHPWLLFDTDDRRFSLCTAWELCCHNHRKRRRGERVCSAHTRRHTGDSNYDNDYRHFLLCNLDHVNNVYNGDINGIDDAFILDRFHDDLSDAPAFDDVHHDNLHRVLACTELHDGTCRDNRHSSRCLGRTPDGEKKRHVYPLREKLRQRLYYRGQVVTRLPWERGDACACVHGMLVAGANVRLRSLAERRRPSYGFARHTEGRA